MDREDKQKQQIIDFNGTFATEEGKRVLGYISVKCREHEPTYVELNPHRTSYLEGMRSVILYIRAQLAKDPHKEKQEKAKD